MDLGLKRPIILKDSAPRCPHCEAMGYLFHSGDQSLWEAFLELSVWENVEELVFSMESQAHPEWEKFTHTARARGFKLSLWRCGHSDHVEVLKDTPKGVHQLYPLVSDSVELARLRGQAEANHGPLFICFHEHKKRSSLKLFERELKQELYPVWAVFPEWDAQRQIGLKGEALHSLFYLTRGRRTGQGLESMPGLELMDVRREELESVLPSTVQTIVGEIRPKFSFVIPAFGDEFELTLVLDRLLALNEKAFELVLVDEGNPKPFYGLFSAYIEKGLQGTYLRMDWKSEAGEKPFRAGRARNLGAKFSRCEILCFLDSDILVGSNYLAEVEAGLRSADAVQAYRQEYTEKGKLAVNSYWEKFRSSALVNWNAIKHPWKYICTHSLSLHRSLFIECGGFSSLFNSYGYEDTDLGYRLFRKGKRFKLLATPVQHIVRREEFVTHKQNQLTRLRSLRRTAGFFMRNHWDQEVYAHLHYLFDSRRSKLAKLTALKKDFMTWFGFQSERP